MREIERKISCFESEFIVCPSLKSVFTWVDDFLNILFMVVEKLFQSRVELPSTLAIIFSLLEPLRVANGWDFCYYETFVLQNVSKRHKLCDCRQYLRYLESYLSSRVLSATSSIDSLSFSSRSHTSSSDLLS